MTTKKAIEYCPFRAKKRMSFISEYRYPYFTLLNDQEYPRNLLVSDWPRRHLLERTSQWVDRKRRLAVYSGFLFLASGLFGVSIFSYALDLT